jgi:hypothetical protein
VLRSHQGLRAVVRPTTQPILTAPNLNETNGVGYFGFWWSAGDGDNQLTVNMQDSTSVVFTTDAIINSPNLATTGGPTGKGHFGNPTANFLGQNDGEAYAFVNIYARNDDSRITDVVFETIGDSGFETDNHTVIAELIDPGSQTGQDVPLPATIPLVVAGLGLIGWTRRRERC